MNDFDEKLNGATENSSAVFSDWVNKLKFDRSFTAKLILSENCVKEYYADIATEILKYAKMKSRTGWSGVTFSVGRERFATLAFAGKTLCLFLALNPEAVSGGKYKTKNVEDVKKHAKTPAMLKIRSEGGKRYALKLIAVAAENFGLGLRTEPIAPVNPANFRADTFNNLVTRGLIRIIRHGRKNVVTESLPAETEEVAGEIAEVGTEERAEEVAEVKADAYEDTVLTIEELLARHGVYNDIAVALSEGSCKASFSEKLMLRAVDEIWVRAIEDCVNSLDELIRKPNHYIAETEEVLPIELTKKITGRSVAHLCRHTDYVRAGEKDDITPMKMLNVFREDSFLTYENKFLNTLIRRLYLFVGKRYSVMKERGTDERTQTLEFENSFLSGEGKARIKISVEYSEREEGSEAKKVLAGSGLWARVERLYSIVTGYVNSSFAKEMDNNFIRPPVLRTNAIIKNKYFRECLALWEFIETYDDSGYGVLVEENEKEISPDFAKRLYENAATLYFSFRRNIDESYGVEESTEYRVIPEVYSPESVRSEKYREEFEKEDEIAHEPDDIAFAILVALAADDADTAKAPVARSKSFAERLCEASDTVKEYFTEICNVALSYKGVKLRYSRSFATLRCGRKPLLRIAFAGRPLKVYFNPGSRQIPEKFRAKDASGVKRYADTPYFVKIKSARGLRNALKIIDLLIDEYSLVPLKKQPQEIQPEDLTYEYFGIFRRLPEVLPETELPLPEAESALTEHGTEDVPPVAGLPEERADKIAGPTGEAVSFGTEKSEITERAAEAVGELAVKESSEVRREEIPHVEESTGESSADVLEGVTRIDNDYEKPTEFGIDDSSGFISDEKESVAEVVPVRKFSFGKRRKRK